MKKWMCVVGAVIGAPIVLGVIASGAGGVVWLLTKLPEVPDWMGALIVGSLAVFVVGGVLAIIGTELYDHCK